MQGVEYYSWARWVIAGGWGGWGGKGAGWMGPGAVGQVATGEATEAAEEGSGNCTVGGDGCQEDAQAGHVVV